MKFIPLVSLTGQVLNLVPITSLTIDRNKSAKAPVLAHLIMAIDRSGSMYGDMAAMRDCLKQVLALQDFHDAELLVSMISYSSQGDTTVHFTRVKVGEIMALKSPQQKQIDGLQATMLTCISGGLKEAEKLVKDGETTCILLHSDGYANHPSAYAEGRSIDEIVARLSKNSNVVVNTIVYSWGDFVLLDGIATKCGGACVQAKSAKDVYKAVHASVALMAGRQAPAIKLEAKGTIFAVSKSARKVMVGTDELYIRGLSDKDDVTAYVAGAPIAARTLETSETVDPEVMQTLARVELASAHLNTAKRLVLASRDSLLYPHLRALTGPQLGEFAMALETAIFDGKHGYVEKYGITKNRPTVAEVVNLLQANRDGFQVSVPALVKGYKRRGLKSILGSRDRTTNIVTPPRTKTAAKKTDWIAVSGFAMNRTAATINMRVMTKQSLHDFKTGAEITEVAGIPLELTDFRNYTIVGDGNVNVPVLTIRVTDKRLRNQLEKMGFTASAENIVEIPFGELDVVPISNVGSELVADEDIVTKLIALRTISSMLENATKGKSTKYTEEQVEALRGVHVTAAMNASIPSTVPYDDKDEAISKGLIDSYTTYKIDIGSTEIPILSEGLESANDGVKRYFEITSKDGKKIDKPTMLDVVEPTNTVKAKPVKTPTAADKAQKPWFDQFAGLTDKGPWSDFLKAMGMDDEDIKEFLGWRTLTADRRVEVFKDVAKKAGEYSDLLFGQTLAPTVIFMGSTGFLPDAIQAEMMAPEDFGAKYKIKIVKALSEATFFVLPDGRVLSVRPETAWYTTPAGAAAIKGEVDDAA